MKIRNSFVANSSSSSFLIVFVNEKEMLNAQKKLLSLIITRNPSFVTPSIVTVGSYYEERLQLLQSNFKTYHECIITEKAGSLILSASERYLFYEDIIVLNKIKELIEKNNSLFIDSVCDTNFKFYKFITNLTEKNIIVEIIEE